MRLTVGFVLLVSVAACDVALKPVEDQTRISQSARTQAGSLAVELDVPAEFPTGKPVPLKLTLRNTSEQPTEVTLGGRPPYDFIVTTLSGDEISRWSEGAVIQAILEIKTLKPRELLEYAEEWAPMGDANTPLSPGSYLVRGVLNLDPPEKLETPPKQLVITSR